MPSNHITLQELVVQEQQSQTQPPDIFVAFTEPASQQWIDCCVNRFSTRVGEHFQISDSGFSVRQVAADQRESEMANLRQLVVEVNREVAEA